MNTIECGMGSKPITMEGIGRTDTWERTPSNSSFIEVNKPSESTKKDHNYSNPNLGCTTLTYQNLLLFL